MLRLFLGLADETAKFLSRLFGTSKVAKTEISQIKEELQSLIDKVGQSEQRAQEAFKPLEDLARQLDEVSLRDDVSATGPITTKVAGQEPLEDLLSDLSDKTGVSPSLIRKILADDVNLGYEAGSPKRLDPFDDDSLKAYIQTQKLMNREGDLLSVIRENADMPRDKAKDYQDIFAIKDRPTYKDLGKTDIGLPKPKGILEEVEEALKANKQQQADLKALEDKMADPKNIDKMTAPGGLGKLMKEVQDDKVVDLAEFRSRRAKDPIDDDDFATGGRVGAKLGLFAGIAESAAKMFGDKGLMKVLFDKVAGMRRADRIADTEQAKNIMRDPETDLERLKPMLDDEGNVIQRGTPEDRMTVRDLEDLPRDLKYENPELRQFEKFIEREKVRAILADRMGVDPQDVPEVNIDMALRDLKFFAMGGRVGFDNGGALAKGKLTPAQIEESIKKQNFIRDNLPDTVIEDFYASGFAPMAGDKAVTNHPILGKTNFATSGAFNQYIDSLYQDYKAKNMPTPTSSAQLPTIPVQGSGIRPPESLIPQAVSQPGTFTTSPGFRPTLTPGIDPLARAYQENAALYNQPLGSVGDVVGRIRKLAGFKQGGIANFFKERVK